MRDSRRVDQDIRIRDKDLLPVQLRYYYYLHLYGLVLFSCILLPHSRQKVVHDVILLFILY